MRDTDSESFSDGCFIMLRTASLDFRVALKSYRERSLMLLLLEVCMTPVRVQAVDSAHLRAADLLALSYVVAPFGSNNDEYEKTKHWYKRTKQFQMENGL